MERMEDDLPGLPAGMVDWEALTAPGPKAADPEAALLDAEDTIGEPPEPERTGSAKHFT